MSSTDSPCVFFKKRARQAVRSNKASRSSEEEEEIDNPVRRKPNRTPYNPLLHQQTAGFRKQSLGLPDDDDDDDDHDKDTKHTVTYKASYSTDSVINRESVATASLEIDTDHSVDAQTIFEKAQKLNKSSSVKSNVYMGKNNYVQYLEKKDTVMGNASSGFNRKGPMRAPSNLRATVRWDYQPDICKDYKETGFCTFGDSCKFLHDRSDYKHGWQIEQELADGTYGIDGSDNRYEIIHHSSEEELDEHISWECLICRGEYKEPIVTNCRHYFCSECALKRYRKTARCYVCMSDTKGSFKFAKDLLPRLAVMREKRSAKKKTNSDDEEAGDQDQITQQQSHEHGSSLICSEESKPAEDFPSIRPIPAEPKWAEPEAPEYCNTDEEESDD